MRLYTYGTLRVPEIMKAVIGFEPKHEDAVLDNYTCLYVENELFPGIKLCEGESTEGTLYENIDEHTIAMLDAYEGNIYSRKNVQVRSSSCKAITAYAYVVLPEFEHLLSNKKWTLNEFTAKHQSAYMDSHNMR